MANINQVSVNGVDYDILPTTVNDRYLHTNSSTGALEWVQASAGAVSFSVAVTTTWTEDSTAGWYYQDIATAGILSTDSPLVDINLSSATTGTEAGDMLTAYGEIFRVVTSADSVRVYSASQTTTAITLKLLVIR